MKRVLPRIIVFGLIALVIAAFMVPSEPAPNIKWPDPSTPIGLLQYAIFVGAFVFVYALGGMANRMNKHQRQIDSLQAHLPQVPIRRLTNEQRFAILKRDGYRCRICGKNAQDGITLEVDHKVAVANGGTNDPSNLWTLCSQCNHGKGVQYL